jgi:hypothetical protein
VSAAEQPTDEQSKQQSAADRMKALKGKAEKARRYGVVDGLSADAIANLDRLFELSPGHLQLHGPGEMCECEPPEDAPSTASTKWLSRTCAQMTAVILEASTDRIRNRKRYERYTPAPGFRLDRLRAMILLLAQGHVGRGEVWQALVRELAITKDDVEVVERALRELNATEAPAELRYPHGAKHPTHLMAEDGAPGVICDGPRCGGKADPELERLRAVFEAEYRSYAALEGVYAVPLEGRKIGRAVGLIDHSGTSEFGSMFGAGAYGRLGTMPKAEKIKQVVSLIHGLARRDAENRDLDLLPVRAARYRDGYLIDLANEGKYVEVDEHGWRVTDWRPEYPVMLATQRPLSIPVRRVGEDPRLHHLGFEESDSNWHQIRMWAGTAFFCDHERQQMLLTGGSGSGKSKRAESIASIVDPLGTDSNGDPVMGGPLPDDEVLGPMLLKHYLFTSDNLTMLKPEDSDRLCRITTGYRFDRRVLYTTADTYSAIVKRPGLLTGIDVPPQMREDAQNRMLHIHLDSNAPKRPSVELAQERVELGPAMLGALLDDMVKILKAYRAGNYDKQDRFPIVACAAQVFGPKYVQTRKDRQAELARQRAEGDVLLQTVAKVVKYAGVECTEGGSTCRALCVTAPELYAAVNATYPPGEIPIRQWAANPGSLSTRMGHHKDTLKALGLTKVNKVDGKARYTLLMHSANSETATVPEPPTSVVRHTPVRLRRAPEGGRAVHRPRGRQHMGEAARGDPDPAGAAHRGREARGAAGSRRGAAADPRGGGSL